MDKFIDKTILRLRREYSKDELVAALNKQLTERDVEIGNLKSENDELIHKLNKFDGNKKELKLWSKQTKREDLYRELRVHIVALKKKAKDYQRMYFEQLTKNIAPKKMSEKVIVEMMQTLCEESLSPEMFEKWMEVRAMLEANRKDLN